MKARLLVLALLGFFFWQILSPYFVPIFMGGAIAILLYPIFTFLRRRGLREASAALLTTFGVTVLILIPMALVVFAGIKAGVRQFLEWKNSPFFDAPMSGGAWTERMASLPHVRGAIERVAAALNLELSEMSDYAATFAKSLALRFATFAGDWLTTLPAQSVGFLLMVVSIYFCLVDGDRIARFVRGSKVFPVEETDEIMGAFEGLCRSVLLASLVSGFAQALVFVTGALVTGYGHLLILLALVFLCSFVPVVGASFITFGISLYVLVFTESTVQGVVLLVAAIVASLIDGFIRPWVLKGGANLHPLLALLALFGGLQLFGFGGLFLGPILVGTFFVTLQAVSRLYGRD